VAANRPCRESQSFGFIRFISGIITPHWYVTPYHIISWAYLQPKCLSKKMSLCFLCEERRRRLKTTGLTNFSLCTIQIALSAIFPFLTFSTCQLFYELLFFNHSFCFFCLTRFSRTTQTWQMMSALVHSFPERKAGTGKRGRGDFEYGGKGSWQCWKMYATKSTQTFAAAPSWPHSGVTCLAKSFSNAKNPSGKVRT